MVPVSRGSNHFLTLQILLLHYSEKVPYHPTQIRLIESDWSRFLFGKSGISNFTDTKSMVTWLVPFKSWESGEQNGIALVFVGLLQQKLEGRHLFHLKIEYFKFSPNTSILNHLRHTANSTTRPQLAGIEITHTAENGLDTLARRIIGWLSADLTSILLI